AVRGDRRGRRQRHRAGIGGERAAVHVHLGERVRVEDPDLRARQAEAGDVEVQLGGGGQVDRMRDDVAARHVDGADRIGVHQIELARVLRGIDADYRDIEIALDRDVAGDLDVLARVDVEPGERVHAARVLDAQHVGGDGREVGGKDLVGAVEIDVQGGLVAAVLRTGEAEVDQQLVGNLAAGDVDVDDVV